MNDNASICKAQLRLGERARDKYAADMVIWNAKRIALYNREQVLKTELNDLDEEMKNKYPWGVLEASTEGCAVGWNETNCYKACLNEYVGITTPWKNNKTRVTSSVSPAFWVGPCWGGEKRCECLYQKYYDDNGMTTKIKELQQVQADIKNHEMNEYPKPAKINVQCCSNEMGCMGGRCYGNVQTCETIVANLENTQDEPTILINIESINVQINKLIENINYNQEYFEIYYNNFQNFDYSKNYKLVYQQLKNLYDNSTNYYNQIFEDVESILMFINDIKVSNTRITATSTYKKKSNKILTELTDIKSDIIINEFRKLLEKYVEIKDVYKIFDDEKKNYETMVNNKEYIDQYIISLNKNFNKIIEEYGKMENYVILHDDDKKKIFNLYEFIYEINTYIQKNIEDAKQKINSSELLYYTYNENSCQTTPYPCSLYQDVANQNLNDSKYIITQMEKKYDETNEIINKSKSIYLLKIDTYEKNKKLKYDEMLLNIYEEQEKEQEKEKEDIIELNLALLKFIQQEDKMELEQELRLQKLIEDENKFYINNNVNLNILSADIISDINKNNTNINTNTNNLDKTSISLIIGGIAVLLIISIAVVPIKAQ